MSIEPISASSSSPAQLVQRALHVAGGQGGVQKAVMGAGAKALGITLSELKAALASGQTLTTIAASHNVSVATLTSMMGSAATQANPSLSPAQAQQTVQRIITSSGSTTPRTATPGLTDGH